MTIATTSARGTLAFRPSWPSRIIVETRSLRAAPNAPVAARVGTRGSGPGSIPGLRRAQASRHAAAVTSPYTRWALRSSASVLTSYVQIGW